MSSLLRPCTACGRHLRITETACPFCAAAVTFDEDRGGTGAGSPAGRGLTRAALLFASAATIGACTGGPDTTSSSSSSSSSGQTSSGASSSTSSSGSSGSSGSSSGDGTSGAVALYGPAPVDAGNDNPPREGGTAVPLYGPPPFDG